VSSTVQLGSERATREVLDVLDPIARRRAIDLSRRVWVNVGPSAGPEGHSTTGHRRPVQIGCASFAARARGQAQMTFGSGSPVDCATRAALFSAPARCAADTVSNAVILSSPSPRR
jgi:hypothetical protein